MCTPVNFCLTKCALLQTCSLNSQCHFTFCAVQLFIIAMVHIHSVRDIASLFMSCNSSLCSPRFSPRAQKCRFSFHTPSFIDIVALPRNVASLFTFHESPCRGSLPQHRDVTSLFASHDSSVLLLSPLCSHIANLQCCCCSSALSADLILVEAIHSACPKDPCLFCVTAALSHSTEVLLFFSHFCDSSRLACPHGSLPQCECCFSFRIHDSSMLLCSHSSLPQCECCFSFRIHDSSTLLVSSALLLFIFAALIATHQCCFAVIASQLTLF